MKLPAIATCCLLLTPTLIAQDAKGTDKATAEASMNVPKPGPEHESLKSAAGSWDALVETAGQPSCKGSSEMKMMLNGFWLVDHFTCDWNGMKFEGHGTTGYDPIKKKYVGTWQDNSNPALMVCEGTFDQKTKTLTMVGDTYNEKGEKVKVRNLTIHKDANTVVFEMYHTGADGKEAKVMTITYTRRK